MQSYTDTIVTDLTGNVISVLNPEAKFKVLLAGHIDEIGLILTHVLDNGLIRVVKAGGIDANHYPGHKVVTVSYTHLDVYKRQLLYNDSFQKNCSTPDIIYFRKRSTL